MFKVLLLFKLNFPVSNILSNEKRAQVISCLVEGNSIRSTVRMTGVAKNTVVKLLGDVGRACADYQDKAFRNLKCKRLEADEVWSFCYAKAKNVPRAKAAPKGAGDLWTWTVIDADTKLVPCWHVGNRDAGAAMDFMFDLSRRMAHRVQLTTDGLQVYIPAVSEAFGTDIDYAMLVKIYGEPERHVRYSPLQCTGIRKAIISGNPESEHISTSFVERQNLNMRMGMRRFTRLTNAFSKKVENHEHMLALYFMCYNYCRVHQTLRVTPAMEAGISDHVWGLDEVIALLGSPQAKPA
jgi:IS1 family transposase